MAASRRHLRTPIEPSKRSIRLPELRMDAAVKDRKAYEKRLSVLQMEMLRIQQAYYHSGRRAVILFEGSDASGKGGTIRRLTERLDPRGFQVWPIGAPKRENQAKHYLYRFWTKLPGPGFLTIFDRSWYGRVLVERVEGFAAESEWRRAFDEINEFERLLHDDGVRFIKIYLHISPEEQLKRFAERLSNPAKRWKLTEEDIRNRGKWDAYVEAAHDMFDHTSTTLAPWHAVAANRKWYARTAALNIVTKGLKKGVDIHVPPIDPAVVEAARSGLGLEIEHTIKVTMKPVESSQAPVPEAEATD